MPSYLRLLLISQKIVAASRLSFRAITHKLKPYASKTIVNALFRGKMLVVPHLASLLVVEVLSTPILLGLVRWVTSLSQSVTHEL